jgi:hypothetical protein
VAESGKQRRETALEERERERERESDRETMASGEVNAVENHDDAVSVELPAPQGWRKMVRSLFFLSLFLFGFRFEYLFLARFRSVP